MGGHAAALGRVSAQMSVSSVVSECTGGVTFYQWLKAQEENWNWNSLREKLTVLYAKAVSKEQLTISMQRMLFKCCRSFCRQSRIF